MGRLLRLVAITGLVIMAIPVSADQTPFGDIETNVQHELDMLASARAASEQVNEICQYVDKKTLLAATKSKFETSLNTLSRNGTGIAEKRYAIDSYERKVIAFKSAYKNAECTFDVTKNIATFSKQLGF